MWKIGNKKIKSRFLLGTSLYPSLDILLDCIDTSSTQILTVSLRRQFNFEKKNIFWEKLKETKCIILPNTSGCFSAKEAVETAKMAREIFETNWIKLEVIGDEYTLIPNSFELLKAASILIKNNFKIFPYCSDDLVLCGKLIDLGCDILMPLASPIGSGMGIVNSYNLKILRRRFKNINLIIDAGIRKPSDASKIMEIGFDGVLINSAISLSDSPSKMAQAFSKAIQSGRLGFKSGFMPKRNFGKMSTPLFGKPFLG